MTLKPITNFKDSNGVDLGIKLVTKDYLISVYPEIADKIGISPELWTWGNTFNGRLGNGVTAITSVSTPITTFAGGTNWKQISNNPHTAVIKTDGTLWSWGAGGVGQLGNSKTVASSTPVTTFAGGTDWKQVSCSNQLTAAIKTDGTLWTWGEGSNGQLGNAQITNRSTPVTTFAGGTDWKQVSSNGEYVSAIKTDGTLWTWGTSINGQLGNALLTSRSTPVTTFAGGTNWKQVSCGLGQVAAIKTDGTLWTWGNGSNGVLGNAQTTNKSTPVTTFAGGNNWKQVSYSTSNFFGLFHIAAIKTDGTLWAWGNGSNGILGNAQTTNKSTPVTTFAGGNNWKQVNAGGNHTAAIKTDGTLWTWGNGTFGRLGNAVTTTIISTPVTTFAGGTNWKQVSCGNEHITAIKSVDI